MAGFLSNSSVSFSNFLTHGAGEFNNSVRAYAVSHNPAYFTHSLTIGIISILPVKVLMFCMTLYKCSQHLLGVGSAARMPVITLFLRDGVFFFFAVLLYTVIEIIIWNKGRDTLVEVPIKLHTVLGARILLNIKNLTNEVHDGTVSTIQVSTISYPHRSAATQARIPWYLKTGEEHEEHLEELNEGID
ncbi:hypothetical protein B0H14DRAFT_2628226 [Mycena olivaceomarginata]|nr:hypothetical protein B0H14DRAFT_2628226 [Mycena olivaceomarginata]